MSDREPLPEGTTVENLRAAIQAAWAAGDYILVTDLVTRYLEDDLYTPTVCYCCADRLEPNTLREMRLQAQPTVFLCTTCWQQETRRLESDA